MMDNPFLTIHVYVNAKGGVVFKDHRLTEEQMAERPEGYRYLGTTTLPLAQPNITPRET